MNNEKLITKTVFCPNEQIETKHVLSADGNGEILVTCLCGSFFKQPAGVTREQFTAFIAQYKVSNQGQITQESINKTLSALADNEAEIETKETVE